MFALCVSTRLNVNHYSFIMKNNDLDASHTDMESLEEESPQSFLMAQNLKLS